MSSASSEETLMAVCFDAQRAEERLVSIVSVIDLPGVIADQAAVGEA